VVVGAGPDGYIVYDGPLWRVRFYARARRGGTLLTGGGEGAEAYTFEAGGGTLGLRASRGHRRFTDDKRR